MLLVNQAFFLNKENLERFRASLPSVQLAVAAIFSSVIVASIVFVGCFQVNEHREYVMKDPAECFLFLETINSFLNALV